MTDTLIGKAAIVTGAGRGLGSGVARLLAAEGAAVVVNDLGVELDGSGGSASHADGVVARITAAGGEAVASHDSVTTFEAGEALVRRAVDAFGRLDIVVTCHGILRDRMIFNMTEQEWDDVIAVHLTGTFNVVRHAARRMREQRSGRIITFSSTSGLWGSSGQANYGAAKSGIGGLTKVVARDVGQYGVTANAIVPMAATRMTTSVPNEARAARASSGIALGTPGEATELDFDPEDVAPFVAYLASDFAAGVNGQFFFVYGKSVSLMSQPRLERTVLKPEGFWSVEELVDLLPQTITKDLPNPAPAAEG